MDLTHSANDSPVSEYSEPIALESVVLKIRPIEYQNTIVLISPSNGVDIKLQARAPVTIPMYTITLLSVLYPPTRLFF